MRELTAQYLAGLFDGEGYVSVCYCVRRTRLNSPRPIYGFRLAVGITMTRKGIIKRLHKAFGGTFHMGAEASTDVNRKTTWSWRVQNFAEQRHFLTLIQPHALVKQKAIKQGLLFLSTAKAVGKRTSDADWAIRVAVHQRLNVINQRGLVRHKMRLPPNQPPEDWRPSRRLSPEEFVRFWKSGQAAQTKKKITVLGNTP